MVRFSVSIFLLLAIMSGCSPTSNWKTESPSSVDPDPHSRTSDEISLPSESTDPQGVKIQMQLLPGTSQMVGSQISGYVSLSNNVTQMRGSGVYGQLEMSTVSNR